MAGRGRVIGKIGLALGSVLLVLCALELTLRAWPTLLGYSFANGALSRYTTRAGGIYYYDRGLRMNFMIPDHRTTMFYNGYVWTHQTDALGFRNEPLHVPADVMLLGDSVVYGHGVEFADTVGRRLEQRTGLRVTNLGQQSTCVYQQTYVFTAYLPVFRPRFVVHVFSPNDIDDLYVFLSDAAMQAFIAQPLDGVTYPPRTDPARLLAERQQRIRERRLGRRLEDDLYVSKMARWLEFRWREWRRSGVAEAAARHAPAGASVDPISLGWRYTEHALAYMSWRAAETGARFLMAPFVQGRQLEILRDIAARHAIALVDTTPLFTGPATLPNDGHLSPHGAGAMAELIATHLSGSPARAAR